MTALEYDGCESTRCIMRRASIETLRAGLAGYERLAAQHPGPEAVFRDELARRDTARPGGIMTTKTPALTPARAATRRSQRAGASGI